MLEQSAMARTLLLWEGFLLKFDWLVGLRRAQSSSAVKRNTTESGFSFKNRHNKDGLCRQWKISLLLLTILAKRKRPLPSVWVSSLHTLSLSALPWMYLLYSLILRAQLRSGCLTVFFSLRLALANQLETCTHMAKFRRRAGSQKFKAFPAGDLVLPAPESYENPEPIGLSLSL